MDRQCHQSRHPLVAATCGVLWRFVVRFDQFGVPFLTRSNRTVVETVPLQDGSELIPDFGPAAPSVSRQHCLHTLEDRFIYDGLMLTIVQCLLVLHSADVCCIGQKVI